MPFLDPEAKRQWQRAYQAQRRATLKLIKRAARLKKYEQYQATMTAYNRKKGSKERPVGKKAKKRVRVSKIRRWTIIPDQDGRELAYFNKETGYDREELEMIVKMLRAVE